MESRYCKNNNNQQYSQSSQQDEMVNEDDKQQNQQNSSQQQQSKFVNAINSDDQILNEDFTNQKQIKQNNDGDMVLIFQVQCSKVSKDDQRIKFLQEEDKIDSFFNQSQQQTQYSQQSTQSEQLQGQNLTSVQSLQSKIKLEVQPRQQNIKIQSVNQNLIPFLITLKTTHQNDARVPIDIVCVVDNSASMATDNKIKLVRKSLRYLLKVLSEQDRICIITYSLHSKIRTGFLKNSLENKEKIKQVIKKIMTASSTNTLAGLDDCFWMLQHRNQRNPLSCIFLLSDGKDDNANQLGQKVTELFYNTYKMQDQNLVINTFGYGNDHDPKEMIGIAQLKNGEFYYIKEYKKISEYFLLALSGLLTVMAQNIKITLPNQLQVKSHQSDNIYYLKFKKGFGADKVWSIDKEQSGSQQIQMQHILYGDKKQFICEYELEQQQQNIHSQVQLNSQQQNFIDIQFEIDAQMEAEMMQDQANTLSNENVKIQTCGKSKINIKLFQADASLNFNNNISQSSNIAIIENEEDYQIDQEVEINYLRAKGAEIIGEACRLAEQDKYTQAEQILNNIIQELQNSPFKENQTLQIISKDCIKSLELCKPKVFKEEGMAFMISKEHCHIKRKGSISYGLDWSACQEEIMDEYKQGKMQLSDDSCPSKMGSDADSMQDEMDVENVRKVKFGYNNNKYQQQQFDEDDNINNQLDDKDDIDILDKINDKEEEDQIQNDKYEPKLKKKLKIKKDFQEEKPLKISKQNLPSHPYLKGNTNTPNNQQEAQDEDANDDEDEDDDNDQQDVSSLAKKIMMKGKKFD